jgi:hypothetical protein
MRLGYLLLQHYCIYYIHKIKVPIRRCSVLRNHWIITIHYQNPVAGEKHAMA